VTGSNGLPDQQAAERRGEPYFLYLDQANRPRIFSLPDSWERATIGRSLSADLVVSWDESVSTIHAELHRLADHWVLIDDGMSRNGSFVNGEQVRGRRRLDDGDVMRLGSTSFAFHAPFQAHDETAVRELPPLPGDG
jgi:pSer/pThr/pTyr-binding forkhead associated (FHA) protein